VTAAEQMNTVDAAVDLIGLGCVVVQIAPGEKRTIGRTKALLRTREAVTAAYRATPHAEVGVDLQASRLVDIDLDDRDGRHLLDPLLRDVATPTFTSRRGTHFLFNSHPSLTTNRNLQAVDGVRAEVRVNGIVVTPPSTGRVWVSGRSPTDFSIPFADLPSKLVKLVKAGEEGPSRRIELVREVADAVILEGQRNMTLTSMVGRWFASGLDETTVRGLAMEANATQCSPPLKDTEVERVVASISGREARGRHRMSGLARYTMNVADFLDGPASELDDATFGSLIRLHCHAWRRDGLPGDATAALRLVGTDTPPLREALDHWFPLGVDGRRRNLDQELERERFELIRERRRENGRLGGLAAANATASGVAPPTAGKGSTTSSGQAEKNGLAMVAGGNPKDPT
jgi:hypothetical protein